MKKIKVLYLLFDKTGIIGCFRSKFDLEFWLILLKPKHIKDYVVFNIKNTNDDFYDFIIRR